MLTSRPSKSNPAENAAVVRDHFVRQSAAWAGRYGSMPRSMADLDLALRRESVHRLLWPVIGDSARKLRVLDVGCGTGDVLDGLPRDLIQVIGVDFVPQMAATANATHPSDRFLTADARRLPFADATMDVVTSLGMLEYTDDARGVLDSMHHVLREDGLLIVSFPNRRCLFRSLLAAERWVDRWVHRIRYGTPINPARSAMEAKNYFHHQWTLSEVRRLLASTGFAVESVILHSIGPWGRVGRQRWSIGMSRLASRLIRGDGHLVSMLASTIVIRARKQDMVANRGGI